MSGILWQCMIVVTQKDIVVPGRRNDEGNATGGDGRAEERQ